MITRQTRIQLIVFVIITLIGGAFVGGRYAKVDRLVIHRTYAVVAQFKDSGGIFVGAQVTYRGIAVGRVGNLSFDDSGVKVRLDIEKSAPKIPSAVTATVADKSAVGEQYVDLAPTTSSAPYLHDKSVIPISETAIPVDTTTLLVNVNDLVKSINTADLKTVVDELGTAFEGTGPALSKIIDTSTEFIDAAQKNLSTTQALIRDSDSVLQTQIDKTSDIEEFSKNLADFSDTLRSSDPDLRRLLDEGPSSAQEINGVVQENSSNLTELLNNLVTGVAPLSAHVTGLQAIYILYPYLLQGTLSVVEPAPDGVNHDAAFGLVVTPTPTVCKTGYTSPVRPPADLSERELNTSSTCTDQSKVARNPDKSSFDNRTAVASGSASLSSLLLDPTSSD